ncbi:hypothetical protein GUITHDRAFT_159001 [Guillardia theta CCMP2712]|uniref:tRNA (guanine(26)-N(2))-dimethyltransferase n=1 Tax=Guillardia theta (strain CCMP2712) TaxID=905079 RepID=L1I7Q5_GUITC|nr:hypothetical protein GUITHDRAFT_159001 [Guillardia theta CCMP2712]EKX32127.1 hypothetical protein GUITHDRAFT_159001 [Guillardia theta CCMP2712]|eukprot:XP_005819107.1 hypothetical protein GUITHDRAFT_159001 [Guillardia theta CCMP2712]
MSASGLRAIRYSKEVSNVTRIVASDRDEGAVSSIEENLNLSNVDANLVQVVHRDALEVMFAAVLEGNFFQAIDLDPFGSPSALLGAAVHAMANGGMLCVTCTDMRVLCGMQPEAAYMRYSAMPLRTPYSKEMAIRILINTIQTLATSLGKVAEPVLSVSIDFYIRVFVRLRLNRHAAQRTCTNTAFVYHCRGCESYSLQPMAEVSSSKGISCATGPPAAALQRGASRCCGVGPFVVGGPVWTGPIQNATAIAEIAGILERDMRHLASYSRLDGLLTLLKAELDVPFFMILSSMTKVVRCSAPKITGLRALVKMAGYNVSSSHIDPLAIKTDAPLALLWDLIRAWIKQKQIGILVADDDVAEVNATNRTSTRSVRRPSPLYPKNPEKNWGPKRSVGYRGPAGKRLRTSASEIKKEILPSGMGLPEESLVAKSWDDVAVEKENDQDVEVERGLERTSYMLRRLKEEEEQE